MSFTVDKALQTTDAIGRAYALLASGLAAVQTSLATSRAALDALNDAPSIGLLVQGFVTSEAAAVATLRVSAVLKMLVALDAAALAYGQEIGESSILNLKTYLQWFNQGGGGAWSALASPDFALAHQWVNGGSASAYIGAKQVYSPANADIGHITVTGGVIGTFAPGTPIDTSLYAGAAIPQLTTAGITGTGNVNVIGQAYDADGVLRTGRVFAPAAVISANGTVTLVPGVAGDILTKVTNIEPATGLTAGTFTVKAAIPTNAPNRVAS